MYAYNDDFLVTLRSIRARCVNGKVAMLKYLGRTLRYFSDQRSRPRGLPLFLFELAHSFLHVFLRTSTAASGVCASSTSKSLCDDFVDGSSADPLSRGARCDDQPIRLPRTLHLRGENVISPFRSDTISAFSSSPRELLRLNNGDLGMHLWEFSSFGEWDSMYDMTDDSW